MIDTPSTGLDQPIDVRGIGLVISDTVSAINKDAEYGTTGLQNALAFVRNVDKVSHFAGVSLAVAFYQMLQKWEQLSDQTFESHDDRVDHFEQMMFEHMGKSKNTVRRYVMAGSLLTGMEARLGRLLPEERETVLRGLPSRPVIDLIAVAQFEREHGSLTPRELMRVAVAEDRSTVRRLLRGFRGEPEPEAQLRYQIEVDGTVTAVQGGIREPIGFLRRDHTTDFKRQAVERLLRRANIQEA